MSAIITDYLWVEKYRPKVIADCILPSAMKKTFTDMAQSAEVQNLLLSGGAGCGKTTIARALCAEVDSDYIIVNCSEDGNIDTLRTRIRNFASTVSMSGNKKVVILDEFDYSNAQSTQPALRGFMEEFSANCRFILTCNFKNRIIEPLHSRCTCINFQIPVKERPALAKQMLKRVKGILDAEGIAYDEKVLVELIMKYFPDFRRILNELQRYSVSGKIDVGILIQLGEIKIKELISALKGKDFISVRKWVVENSDADSASLFRKIYESMYECFASSSIPKLILILAEYQYKAAFVADAEINMAACLTEIMMECEFK